MTCFRDPLLSVLLLVISVFAAAGMGRADAQTESVPRAQAPQTQKVPVDGGGSYTDVSAAALAEMLKQKDFPLINVHIPYEGEINSTDLFVPFSEVEANVRKLPADKSAKLVVYCRSGRMSAIAARTLVKLGYTNVRNLDGGMIAWKETGYPLLERRPK
jgi:rhodanese-related sulfurtransferase